MAVQNEVSVQFRPDSMVPGETSVAYHPSDMRARIEIECLQKYADGDYLVVTAKVTIIVPREVPKAIMIDVTGKPSLLRPQ